MLMQRRVNQRFLSAMLEMGISREKAELALLETKNVGVEMAAEWLFSAPDGMIEKQLEDERHAVQSEQKIVDGSDDKSVLAPRRVPLKVRSYQCPFRFDSRFYHEIISFVCCAINSIPLSYSS